MTSVASSTLGTTPTDRLTGPSLVAYATVLVSIEKLIGSYSQQIKSPADQEADAAQLRTLLILLRDMKQLALSSAPTFIALLDPIDQQLVGVINQLAQGTLVAIPQTLQDALAQALNPQAWVTTVDDQIQLPSINDSLTDYCFYELYRSADAAMMTQMGSLSNRLEYSSQFLNALNGIYQASCWNPGQQFITTTGQLQDYTDPQTGIVSRWFDQFSDPTNDENVLTTITQSMLNLRTMIVSGAIPPDAPEYPLANALAAKFYGDFSNGGFGSAAFADGAARMWADQDFRQTIQNAIEITSRLNDKAQLQLGRLMTDYDYFLRTAHLVVSRDREILLDTARRIKNLGR